MIITFIQPSVIGFHKKSHIRVEPTIFGRLKAMTPDDITCKLYDARVEDIDYDSPTDLVVISLNTVGAKCAYDIADNYLKKGINVVLGGIHVNLNPDEAQEHATSLSLGECETVWKYIIDDFRKGELKARYKSEERYDFKDYRIDLSIFKGKKYLPLHCVETSRGCKYNCNFCSLAPIYKQCVVYREPDDVIEQIKEYKEKYILFVDENFGNNVEHTREIAEKMIPLKKKWIAQMSVNTLLDKDFVKLLKKSGCFGVFIGFESTNKEVLKAMHKASNLKLEMYEQVMKNCVENDITITGGFIAGYQGDTIETVEKTFEFANSFQFINLMFTNLIPIPGTPIYNKLLEENKILIDKWWLQDIKYTKQSIYYTDTLSEEDMIKFGNSYCRRFFAFKNIFYRFIHSKYRWKMRIIILIANIFVKYFFKIVGS